MSLASEPSGHVLLGFERDRSVGRDPAVAMPLSLAVVVAQGHVLLAWHRWRGHWELPGGMIDAGETPHDAAVRELAEETGVVVPALTWVGTARFRLQPDGRLEDGSVWRGTLPAPTPTEDFEANDEMSRIRWWDPATDLPDLSPIDAWLARAAVDP